MPVLMPVDKTVYFNVGEPTFDSCLEHIESSRWVGFEAGYVAAG
jgi:hypothetical protein